MKKIRISFLTVIAAALSAACSNHDETTSAPGADETLVGFQADIAPRLQSRAEIDVDFENGLTGSWDKADTLGVIHKAPNASGFSNLGQFIFDTETRTFKGSLPTANGEWHYRAFYPHNGTATISGTKTTVTVPFSAHRTQNGNRYNSEYDLLAAEPVICQNADQGKLPSGEAVKFNLNRFTTILALRMQGGDPSEKVASVMLTAQKPIASEQLLFELPSESYDPDALTPTLVALGESPAGGTISIDSEHITVTYKDGTAPTADLSETFFNVLPDANYGELVFSVCTDKGNTASVTVNRTTPMVANWVYTKKETGTFTKAPAPLIDWIDHDLEQRYELADGSNEANIAVSVPGGIRKMEVEIIAPILTESGLLEAVGLAPVMELTNPESGRMAAMLGQLGFPAAEHLLNQQHVFFQIGGLIDLLAMVCGEVTETTNSDFKFTVTDNAGQETTVTLQYVKTVETPTPPITPSVAYNEDVNLWKNTATLSCAVAPADFENTAIEYKRADDTAWQTAAKGTQNAEDGTFTATISGAYNEDNTMISATGIRPGYLYEYRIVVNTEVKGSGTIDMTANKGDKIENGGMEDWSETTVSGTNGIIYPNAAGNSFWTSGNNSATKELCTKNEDVWTDHTPGSFSAFLNPNLTSIGSIKIFAAGNLFTGTFDYTVSVFSWSGGTASFGSPYNWTARPTALRVKAKATVNNIQILGAKKDEFTTSDISPARIFVCMCDRDTRIANVSQTKALTGEYKISGTFEPSDTGLGILAYGDHKFTASTDGWQSITIPIVYNDRDETPVPSKAYNIMISCSSDCYGAFFCGSESNRLYVDDFEWIY